MRRDAAEIILPRRLREGRQRGRGDQRILCDDDSAVVCVLREEDGARTLLLANLGAAPAAVPGDAASMAADGWVDLLDPRAGRAVAGGGGGVLAPMEIRILGTP